ncbi:hypothetical protein [Arachnia propionica]|uniref:Uncharacterized protein n=1 Tax=Arachnia propionica TaxID=1750 RepID=A0A3P1WTU6_9ACTN|nr:hypothetical protein [Arachnia propionica]RRD48790.1 hypothetical protein EII35_11325 [Arachnia propionica]
MVNDQDIIDADRRGHLDEAVSWASAQLLSLSGASIEVRVARHIRLARVLRHRGLGDDFRRSLDAARQGLHLASLPTCPAQWRPIAELAVASAHLALGDEATCRGLVDPLTAPGSRADPAVAAWAWRLQGEAALKRSALFEAVPALLNSVAEEQRTRSAPGADATPALLLLAFSRIGQVLDAQKVLGDTDPTRMWPRRRLVLLLARAEHERRYGHIADALETLDDAEELIDRGSGLDRLRARLHLLRASCFDDWRLGSHAQRERQRAVELKIPDAPPPAQPVTRLGESAPITLTSPQPRQGSVMDLIREFRALPCLGVEHAVILEGALMALQGVPGGERTEALALVEAGSLLASGSSGVRATAERLLRRALARLDYLEGTQLWRASCQAALGRLLSETATEKEEALDLLLAAISGLNRERYSMRHRSHRAEWQRQVESPPHATAIDLAKALGRDEIAAELIIHSRLSGVVSAQTVGEVEAATDTVTTIPLAPVPRLHHINGTVSVLGGPGRCRLL